MAARHREWKLLPRGSTMDALAPPLSPIPKQPPARTDAHTCMQATGLMVGDRRLDHRCGSRFASLATPHRSLGGRARGPVLMCNRDDRDSVGRWGWFTAALSPVHFSLVLLREWHGQALPHPAHHPSMSRELGSAGASMPRRSCSSQSLPAHGGLSKLHWGGLSHLSTSDQP